MAYKCQYCGYSLKENSYHVTDADIQSILKHDKECPNKPKS